MSPTPLAGVMERWPAGAALALHLGSYVEVFGPDPRLEASPNDLIEYKCITFPDSPYVVSGSAPRKEFEPLTPLARELLRLPRGACAPLERTVACWLCDGTGVRR